MRPPRTGNLIYPHDSDQVLFNLVQHPVRADVQPTIGAADERVRRRWIVR
jgi:hypothetical protein